MDGLNEVAPKLQLHHPEVRARLLSVAMSKEIVVQPPNGEMGHNSLL